MTEGNADEGANVFMQTCNKFFMVLFEKIFLNIKIEIIKIVKDDYSKKVHTQGTILTFNDLIEKIERIKLKL